MEPIIMGPAEGASLQLFYSPLCEFLQGPYARVQPAKSALHEVQAVFELPGGG
jgi:hypothetical protein